MQRFMTEMSQHKLMVKAALFSSWWFCLFHAMVQDRAESAQAEGQGCTLKLIMILLFVPCKGSGQSWVSTSWGARLHSSAQVDKIDIVFIFIFSFKFTSKWWLLLYVLVSDARLCGGLVELQSVQVVQQVAGGLKCAEWERRTWASLGFLAWE